MMKTIRISEEELSRVMDVLELVGLKKTERKNFVAAVQDVESYGNHYHDFKWDAEDKGTRFVVTPRFSGELEFKVTRFPASDSFSKITAEEIYYANRFL